MTSIDWMLPGIPPTGKYVEVPTVAIVNFRGDKLAHEHILLGPGERFSADRPADRRSCRSRAARPRKARRRDAAFEHADAALESAGIPSALSR
jgi:hypothetical protein